LSSANAEIRGGGKKQVHEGVWQLKLATPITDLPKGQLTVSVKDKQGNVSRIERTLWVGTRAN
jgi:hypothetical protein